MATPIIEQIIAKLKTALEAITVANGYEVTVAEVYRPATIAGYGRTSPGSFTVQLTLDNPDREDELNLSAVPAVVGWSQPVLLDLIYRPSDDATAAIELQLNTFWADVQKAIYANPQWDGFAEDTEMSPPQYWIDEQEGICGVTAVATIRYRILETDPYTQWNA